MSSYKYSPVGLPSSSDNNPSETDDRQALARLMLVAPLYRFLIDPLIHHLPASLVAGIVKVATLWRRLMAHRPIQISILNDVSGAHILLCLPLFWWFIQATELALLRPDVHHSLKHSGFLASYAMAAVFFTANKSNSLVSLVTGLSFDRLVPFHLASAVLTLWMSLLHGIQIAYWHGGNSHEHHDHDKKQHSHDDDHHHHSHDHDEGHRELHHDSIHAFLGPEPNLSQFLLDGKRNTSGFAVLSALILMVATSVFHRVLRKRWFELWLSCHVAWAIVILVVGVIHFKLKHGALFFFVIAWWTLDLIIRYGIMVGVRYPRTATATRVATNVTKLQFDKNESFHYEAGQFVQLSIPSVQLWEFHPFSIASTPEERHVTVYVRALPDSKTWTRKLYDLAAEGGKERTQSVRICLEGPYGNVPPILERPDKYSMAVLISGGIGVTPCHSIAKYLATNTHPSSSLQKIRYIWSIRDEAMIQAIPPPTLEDSGVNGASNDDNGIELVERGQGNQSAGQDTGDTAKDMGDVLTEDLACPLILQNEIFVTQLGKFLDDHQQEDEDVVIDKGIIVDNPIDAEEDTDSYTIHRGRRPHVDAIIAEVQDEAQREGWGRVFVMGCGPVSLLEELEVACRRHQTNDVRIDYHQEVFDY